MDDFTVGRALMVPPTPTAGFDVPGLLRRLAQILLLGLGLALPFEVVLFSIRSLTITLPELLLYLLIAVWFVALLKPELFRPGGLMRPRLALVWAARDPVAIAVVVWMTVTILSALAASSHRVPALKFSLRTLSGVLLYFVARDLVRLSPTARRLVTAIIAGAVLSAALTFLEALKPEWSSWWRLFRPQEFSASGMRRSSGSFAFPNIGAMYWEATLPLLLLIPLRPLPNPASEPRAKLVAMIVMALTLVHAILASATRASIFGVAFVASLLLLCCFGVRIYRRRWPSPAVAQFAGVVLVAEVLLAGAAIWQQGSASVIAQRLLWWREQDWYKVRDIEAKEPLKLPNGDQVVAVEPSSKPSSRPDRRTAASPAAVPLPTRIELWKAALRLWRSSPLLGVGPDNFRHRYGEEIRPADGGTFTDERIHANNLYFEVLADLGLAGIAALIFLIYALARAALRASAPAEPLRLLPLLAALTFLVHGTVDYFFEFTPTFGLWWLLMALAGRGRQEPAP